MRKEKYYDGYWQNLNEKSIRLYKQQGNLQELYNLLRDCVIPYLEKEDLKSIVEIGCGHGLISGYVHSAGKKIEACDISNVSLNYARKKFPRINFFIHDIEKSPLKKKYDGIILFGILEHLFDYDIAIRNVYKSLNENGLIFIQIPCITWIRARLRFLFGNIEGELTWKPHIRFFSVKTIRGLLEESNFEIVRVYGIGKLSLFPSLCGTMLIVARKK